MIFRSQITFWRTSTAFAALRRMLDYNRSAVTAMTGSVMEKLVRMVHESCAASVLDGTEIVYVDKVPVYNIREHQPANWQQDFRLLHFPGPDSSWRSIDRGAGADAGLEEVCMVQRKDLSNLIPFLQPLVV